MRAAGVVVSNVWNTAPRQRQGPRTPFKESHLEFGERAFPPAGEYDASIQVRHEIPLSPLGKRRKTKPEDSMCVSAHHHRALHHGMPIADRESNARWGSRRPVADYEAMVPRSWGKGGRR